MKYIDFGLREYFNRPELYFKYLDLRFKYGGMKRKDILRKANVYQSAFSRAKQNNYSNCQILIDKFNQYYQLDYVTCEMLNELDCNLYQFVSSIYYMDKELMEIYYRELKEKEAWFSTTYISVLFKLFDLMYEVSNKDDYEVSSQAKQDFKCIHLYQELLTPSLQLLYLFVSFTLEEHTLITLNQAIGEMETLLVSYPDLRGCGLYRAACGFKKIGAYNASIQYYLESMDFVARDLNTNRMIRIEKQLFDLYNTIGTLHKAYEEGSKLVHVLNKIDTSYSEICYEYSMLCLQLGYYQEALMYCSCLDYRNVNKYRIAYMLACYKVLDYNSIIDLYSIGITSDEVYGVFIEYIYNKVRRVKTKCEMKQMYNEIVRISKRNTHPIYKYIELLK